MISPLTPKEPSAPSRRLATFFGIGVLLLFVGMFAGTGLLFAAVGVREMARGGWSWGVVLLVVGLVTVVFPWAVIRQGRSGQKAKGPRAGISKAPWE